MEIQISTETHRKIMHWINKSNDEVSGFGKVIYYPETKVFQIQDAFLIKQTNGAAHTDIDATELARLNYQKIQEPGDLRWWWHSHVNMPVFWSSTDKETIQELGSQGWIAATVFNKRHESRSAISYRAESPFGVTTELKDEVAFHVIEEVDEEIIKAWDTEYDSKVEKKAYTQISHTPGVYKAYDSEDYQGWKRQTSLLEADTQAAEKAAIKMDPNARAVERADFLKEGYYGSYGAAAEARALGIPLPKYLDILCDGDRKQLNEIDRDLEAAIAAGVLI